MSSSEDEEGASLYPSFAKFCQEKELEGEERLVNRSYAKKFARRLVDFQGDFRRPDRSKEAEKLFGTPVFTQITKYENSPLLPWLPKKNHLPSEQDYLDLISGAKTEFEFTVVIGETRDYCATKPGDHYLQVYSGKWTLLKKVPHGNDFGWDYVLLFEGGYYRLVVNIRYNSRGELHHDKSAVIQRDSFMGEREYDCLVIPYKADYENYDWKKHLNFFMESRGGGPALVKKYKEEFTSLVFYLREALDFVSEFLEKDLKKKNYFTFVHAVSETLNFYEGLESYQADSSS